MFVLVLSRQILKRGNEEKNRDYRESKAVAGKNSLAELNQSNSRRSLSVRVHKRINFIISLRMNILVLKKFSLDESLPEAEVPPYIWEHGGRSFSRYHLIKGALHHKYLRVYHRQRLSSAKWIPIK